MKFQYYRDSRGEWRWRLVAVNGRIIGVSSEGYSSKSACLHSIDLVRSAHNARLEEVSG